MITLHPQAHWLILQVFRGHVFRVEEDVESLGIEAYCPKFKVRRPHVFNRKRTVEITKPLFPGYLFTAEPFDVDRLNLGPVHARFMCGERSDEDGRLRQCFLTVTPLEMVLIVDAERKAEEAWRIDEMVRSLAHQKKAKAKFVNLGEIQRTRALAS